MKWLDKNYKTVVIIFFAVYLLVGLYISEDYGISWWVLERYYTITIFAGGKPLKPIVALAVE